MDKCLDAGYQGISSRLLW